MKPFIFIVASLSIGLCACGQKGPLVLPEPQSSQPNTMTMKAGHDQPENKPLSTPVKQ